MITYRGVDGYFGMASHIDVPTTVFDLLPPWNKTFGYDLHRYRHTILMVFGIPVLRVFGMYWYFGTKFHTDSNTGIPASDFNTVNPDLLRTSIDIQQYNLVS